MRLIYLHGLDSSPNANKAIATQNHAKTLGIDCICPDLNVPPSEVLAKVTALLDENCVLIGSSLGGYFANLLSDLTGTPAILLNPSIRPDVSFERFLQNFDKTTLQDDTPIYLTTGGWQIVYQDLAWFENHRLSVKYPNKIKVLLKAGDELLDAQASHAFYTEKGAGVLLQDGGDHRISDYESLVPMILDWAKTLCRSWFFVRISHFLLYKKE